MNQVRLLVVGFTILFSAGNDVCRRRWSIGSALQ